MSRPRSVAPTLSLGIAPTTAQKQPDALQTQRSIRKQHDLAMDPQHIHLIFEYSLIESEVDHCLTKNRPCAPLLSSSPRTLRKGLVPEFYSLRADGRRMPITAYDADSGCRPMFSQPHLVSILPKGTRKPIKWSALRPRFPSARCISHTSRR